MSGKRTWICLLLLLTAVLVAGPARGALVAVSGGGAGASEPVAVSLAHGFPLWYQDGNGVKLALCLDSSAEVAPGVVVNPCDFLPPLAGAPTSFPNNFGSEALYWSAAATGSFASSNGTLNFALLDVALQAGFAGGVVADGSQSVSSRIRLRIDLPLAGTYRVTHPFGSRDYLVSTPGIRAINQTQNRGGLVAGDFLTAMADGPPPVEPVPFVPAVDAGIVNQDGATVGPFLAPDAAFAPPDLSGGPVVAADGSRYLGIPFGPGLEGIIQPVVGAPESRNFLEITLLDPPQDFLLDASGVDGAADNTVRLTGFQIIGKLFDEGPNAAPAVGSDLVAGTTPETPVNIAVFPNGYQHLDAVDAANVHGIDPRAVAILDPVSGSPVLTATVATSQGGSVRRIANIATGEVAFRYTPPTGYLGEDSFLFVVQDTGGLISGPATARVTVEEVGIEDAGYRSRLGKWVVAGRSSDAGANAVQLFAAPRAKLRAEEVVPAVGSDLAGVAGLRPTAGGPEFLVRLAPQPATTVTAIHIHAGNPGANGPAIFTLFNRASQGDFTGEVAGVLSPVQLVIQPAAGIFSMADAMAAILAGEAYVDVHSTAFPAGEVRGQFSRPVLGTAEVGADGRWSFPGKAAVGPGPLPAVGGVSANGVQTPWRGVQLR